MSWNVRKNAIKLMVLAVVASIGLFTSAMSMAQTLSPAPVNPAFTQYLEDARAERLKRFTAEGYRLGYIPSPVNPFRGQWETSMQELRPLVGAPTSYDLRTYGRVSSVKDQGGQLVLGLCHIRLNGIEPLDGGILGFFGGTPDR